MNAASFTVEDDVRRMRDEVFQLRLQHAVLVEGKTDEPFWEHLFEQVVLRRCKIYAYVNFPTDRASGKSVIKAYYLSFASRDLCICLDSDFDYLLETEDIRKQFVFQTCVYSIENYMCHAPALAGIFALGTRVKSVNFDFEAFIAGYSGHAYKWLVYQLYQKKTHGEEIGNPPVFELITDPDSDLYKFGQRIEWQIGKKFSIISKNPDFQQFVNRMDELGLAPQSAYLFVRGHSLLDGVVLKLLKWLAEPVIRHEFSRLSAADRNEYTKYQKRVVTQRLTL